MRLVIQRVLHAEVQVDGETVGQIQKGLLVFVGAGQNDTKEIADKYLKKLLGLPERCKRSAVTGVTVYPVCQLPKRQSAQFC